MASTPSTTTGDFGLKDHIILCNWSSKADIIVRQLHDESVHDKSPIIVITEHPEEIPRTTDPAYRGLLMIGGDPADKEILERADVNNAKTVVVLADEKDPENSDAKAILIVLAIDAINPNVHVIVELLYSRSETYFKYTHVNEIICLEQLAEKLLAQSALTPGLSQVYMDLLTQSLDTNEIYQEPVPDQFIGKSYRELEKWVLSLEEKDLILIGFSTMREKREGEQVLVNSKGRAIQEKVVIINPRHSSDSAFSKDHKFRPGDTIFLMAYEKPELADFFAQRSK